MFFLQIFQIFPVALWNVSFTLVVFLKPPLQGGAVYNSLGRVRLCECLYAALVDLAQGILEDTVPGGMCCWSYLLSTCRWCLSESIDCLWTKDVQNCWTVTWCKKNRFTCLDDRVQEGGFLFKICSISLCFHLRADEGTYFSCSYHNFAQLPKPTPDQHQYFQTRAYDNHSEKWIWNGFALL